MRIAYDAMWDEFYRALTKHGMEAERARLCAKLFADASCDGVYSHGVNRFSQFIGHIRQGRIKANETPERIGTYGLLERWDGRSGPGNLNAYACMDRAIALSRSSGIGCVALSNTNHWLRAGTYGWQAAEAGCIAIGWTNTVPNMPPWGAKQHKIGNNPLVLAVPREDGPIVLDFAMSQYSYGQLRNYERRGELLPFTGGFDTEGNATRDASAVLASKRLVPTGYWKGSGLSILLDLIAMMLSGGHSSLEIAQFDGDYGVSQVFIAFDVTRFPDRHLLSDKIERTILDLHQAAPAAPGEQVRYPGEGTLALRRENLQAGIPVDEAIWQEVLRL